MAVYEAMRPVMRLWYAFGLTRGSSIPKPRSVPSVQTGVDPAETVLLVGNGPAHGWGVASHGLAITGQLAGELSVRLRRSCRVDYVGDEVMDVAAARAWLGERDLSEYSTAVVVLGMNDAVRLTPVRAWERHLAALLDYLSAELPRGARIAVSTIQRARTVPSYAGPLGAVAERHAARLNAATHGVAATRPGIDLFEIGDPDSGSGSSYGSPAVYAGWARRIADHTAPALALTAGPAPVAEPVGALDADVLVAASESAPDGTHATAVVAGAPEQGWLESVPQPGYGDILSANRWSGLERAVELVSGGGMPALQKLTRTARSRFGTEVATVSLIDGDRLWYVVPDDGVPNQVPVDLAHCKMVIDVGEPLLVPNSRTDDRFRDSPLIELSHMRFYAGYPLFSSTGETIGSFCLMGAFPRRPSALSMTELGNLAKRAQLELWKLEPRD